MRYMRHYKANIFLQLLSSDSVDTLPDSRLKLFYYYSSGQDRAREKKLLITSKIELNKKQNSVHNSVEFRFR